MVNNEENWLPWQIKDWFNKKDKKFPKSAQSLGLVKFQVPSPQMDKDQSSFWIIAILYTYQACKTLFRPIKPTNPSIQMSYKGQSSLGKPATVVI